eukprot:Rmarinus@m.29737
MESVFGLSRLSARWEQPNATAGSKWISRGLIDLFGEYVHSLRTGSSVILPTRLLQLTKAHDKSAALSILRDFRVFKTELLLFPVNTGCGGGTHWVLLTYSRIADEWRCYDSMNNGEPDVGFGFSAADALQGILKLYAAENDIFNKPTEERVMNFEFVPQQENGYDCGLFVLKFMEYVV